MNRRFVLLLFCTSSLFLVLFSILSFYSRLATDDYYFIGDIKNHGVFEQVYFQYMNWSGRYAATLPINIIYNIFGLNQIFYNILPPLSLLMFVFGVYFLLKNVQITFQIDISKKSTILYSISASALLFFLSYDIGESWFWYCGYSSYLWSITALVWGISCIINPNTKWPIVLIGVISFIYVGGASELYSAIIGLYFTIYLLLKYRNAKIKNEFFYIPQNKKLILFYISFSIAFILLIAAPGNYLRDGLFPEHSFLKAFFITAKSIVKFLIIYLPSKLVYIICYSPLFILIGISLKKSIKTSALKFNLIFKKITLAFIGTLILFFYLIGFVMVETGPARVLLFVSFILTIYISTISFFAGLLVEFKSIKSLKFIFFTSTTLMLLFHILNQSIIVSKYSSANDKRIAYLKSISLSIKPDTLILLPALPPCGMLYSSEITTDTTHFTNRELKMGYDLPFYVAKEK